MTAPSESVAPPAVEGRGTWWKLATLLGAALLIRLCFFTGLVLGDDVLYATQAAAMAQGGSWPPEPLHWHTRLGVVLPTALSLACLGTFPLAFVLWPLVASTLSVWVCFAIADDLTDRRTAWLAAVFQAAFPLEVIYSTHLFPDVLVGLFSTLSIWFWIRALRGDRGRDYVWCGAFFAAGYLCRETVLMLGPVYLALWAWAGRVNRPRLAWVFLAPLLVLVLECGVYAATADSALYRWNAIAAQQRDPENLELTQASVSGGNFWTDPLLMIAARQEFALYHALAFPVAVYALWRWPKARPLAIWLTVGFVWIYYGTTAPAGWVTLQRDPRYAASLTAPGVILLAYGLGSLSAKLCWPVAALLIVSGLFAAGLDQGKTIRAPHRAFVDSEYAAEAALEPFEYVAARWELGLDRQPAFRCAADRGRGSVVRLLDGFGRTTLTPSTQARYFVFSPERRPDLLPQLTAKGWVVVATIPGEPTASRRAVARLLELIPSQQERARRIMHPPGLLILKNPRLPKAGG
jgi:hypothetical protein